MRRPLAAWLTATLPAAALPFALEGLQALGLVARVERTNMAPLVFLTPLALLPAVAASLLWERRWTLRGAIVLAALLAYGTASIISVLLFSQPAPGCVTGQSCP